MNPVETAAIAGLLHGTSDVICSGAECTTICNRYVLPGVVNSLTLVEKVVIEVVGDALNSSLLVYFDGTKGGKVDFTDPANTAAYTDLYNHLVQFFAAALGCSDGYVTPYGPLTASLQASHAGMGITDADFDLFNSVVVARLTSNGVDPADGADVLALLETTRPLIVEGGAITSSSAASSTSDVASTTSSAASTTSGAASTTSAAANSTSGAASTSSAAASTSAAASSESASGFGAILIAPIVSLISMLLF